LEFWDKLLRVFLDMVDLLANPFLMDAVVCWKPRSSSGGWLVGRGKLKRMRDTLPVDAVFMRDFMFVSVLMNHLGNLKCLNLAFEM
jgi:hypothetical protein